jgi:cation:H+ antiporter
MLAYVLPAHPMAMIMGDFFARLQATWHLFQRFEPWFSLTLFFAGSFLMIWRLGALERKGLEGTVLGTLIMPYASGFANLMFAYVMGKSGGNGILVLENCLVNNVTNLTLLIGLPALIWSLSIFPEKRADRFAIGPRKVHRLNYLSLLMTLVAVIFFTGTLWALGKDGILDLGDGLVLVGFFIFWQIFHIFDVLKHNVRRGRSLHWSITIDIFLVIAAGLGVYKAIDWIVQWIPRAGTGIIVFHNLGWLSGLLMVLPNALLALYYAHARRADIVYSSQIGDGHICIPMCIGMYALFTQIQIPAYMNLGVLIILGASVLHFLFIAFWGGLPRFMGWVFAAGYAVFVYKGFIQ